MRINSVSLNSVINNSKKQSLKASVNGCISNPKAMLGTGMAAISGMYLLNKAVKENANTNVYNDKGIKIKTTTGEKDTCVHSMVREYKNPRTGRMETLKMKLSDIPGVYNSTITDDKGNTRIESSGTRNPDGSVSVEKHLESFDGTMTHYTYNASKDENNIKMSYIVESPDGKILSKLERTFTRIDENLIHSSINGKEFLIEKNNDRINIADLGEEKAIQISVDDIFYDEEARKHSELIDKMSGDMLYDMYLRGYRYNYIDNPDITEMEPCEKILSIKNDLFDFCHELGHTKDLEYSYDDDFNLNIKYNLAQNPEFREIFEQEREDFIKNSSKIEQKYVDYFIEKEGHYNEENGGAAEFIAETNALMSTATGSACNDHLCARDYYIQKYFPKSIAAASKILF